MQPGGESNDRKINESTDGVVTKLARLAAVRAHADNGYWPSLNDSQRSGIGSTGDGKTDFRGTADGVSNEVSSRLHSTGPWWV
ncbi:hypothetical protein HMPREF2806_08380 [Corynebacterium sp. HMSC076G08]|nr:hypothetical protein HMPREF2806_08380 [Corynebacterium sp. HMSC076G08]